MSPLEKQELKALFVATSMYYGHEIPNTVLPLYVADLEDLDYAEVVTAIRDLRRDPKTTRSPLPAHIRARLNMAEDPDSVAVMTASQIIGAISKYGPYQHERARRDIGEIGWRVIEMEGGWGHVCQNLTFDNMSTLKAQWRQLAKALIARSGDEEPPALASMAIGGFIDMKKLLKDMPND